MKKGISGSMHGIIIVLTGTMIFSACEHNVNEPKPPVITDITYETIIQEVFTPCSFCHLGGNKSGGLDLSRYEIVVNTPSSQRTDLMLILPNSPDSSYLYMKVTGAEEISGSRMPVGGELSDDQLTLLKDWIEAGAPETFE